MHQACVMAVLQVVTSPGERYGEIRRVENRFNGSVNQYFLCDKGRFGTGYVNRADRPRQPQFRNGETVATVSVDKRWTKQLRNLKVKSSRYRFATCKLRIKLRIA